MTSTELSSSEYNIYYKGYIDLVKEAPLVPVLEEGMAKVVEFFKELPISKWQYRYAENKWTPKDILQHIIDTERVFAYRALYFSRADDVNLIGFDENLFADNALANTKTPENILQEYIAVRNASICLFKAFEDIQLKRTGTANGSDMSVAAIGFIICGHELHHVNIINERYL
ncbi:DinB family protein [Aequorivita lipolytica]|uniref:DinB family protein n=1 Tax=Aequorivita lipolytica TaxID=153267 RepID=A0A5C6YMY4_9FLAO|nr:DinB family protein [Aequorivita lipolytica]TXD68395.1 DinB family protein [Aequorivita lipolytica]SRX51462.1 hypothetical protein AEQU2_01945 [Aequorivita lipolytica]